MPNYTQRLQNNFIRGLITEAGEMTFPEGASVDELNCDLYRDGTRRRRRAIAKETNHSTSTFTISANSTVSFGTWRNVGSSSYKEYLVVQVGSKLYFYDKGSLPFSSQEFANSVNLASYQISGANIADHKCQFSSILGYLVVVNAAMEPVYIEETSTGVFAVTQINPRVRDFEWQGDKTTYDEELATASVSQARKYDTANVGWTGTQGSAALTTYETANTAYPPLTHRWYAGKDSSGNFSESEWQKVFSGTTLLENGHYVLNLFNKDRSTESGISGITTEVETTRFVTAETFSSRVFFSGLTSANNAGKVYFSPVLDTIGDIGDFHQRNDPTAEDFSDLLDDDGGVIVIPEAAEIRMLYGFRNSIFVFAENGVWQITGVDNAFTATAYSISKISDNGILTAQSFVSAEGVPFWWSRYGIHTMSFDEFGNASEENLSIGTIQTHWNNISSSAKDKVQAEYDRINKKIVWIYPAEEEGVPNKLRRMLVLDIVLQAFYPWEISDAGDYVIGASFYSGFGTGTESYDVVVGSDSVVVGSDDVVVTTDSPLSEGVALVFFVRDETTSKMTMALINSDTLLDWGSEIYSSYAETGYDFSGDVVLKKTAPYIVVYCRETETGWTGSDASGYDPINESSLKVSAYWDFKKNPSSTAQQAYKRKQPIIVDSSDLTTFDSPATVLTSRLKVRGRGRSMRIRFESETDKDFILIGHGVIVDVASRF